MDGTYEIGTDHIRALAIQCHALDLQFDRLFNSQTICGESDRIYRAYNRLLSTTLLNLAISIRVSLSKEEKYTSRDWGINNAGMFLDGEPKKCGNFSVKDICDKLIHAERIYKPIEPGHQGACCELHGSQHGKSWVFGLGVQVFSEYLLLWLDELDGIASNAKDPE